MIYYQDEGSLRDLEVLIFKPRESFSKSVSALSRIRLDVSHHTLIYADLPLRLPLLKCLSNQQQLELTLVNFIQYVFVTVFILSGFMEKRENNAKSLPDSSENLIEQNQQGPAVSLAFSFPLRQDFSLHPGLTFSHRLLSSWDRTAAVPQACPDP